MDPADPNSLCQAMASHGRLLGQHELYFRELKEALSTLTAQIGSLTLKVEQRPESTAAEDLRAAVASPVVSTSQSAGNAVAREPNIPHPPRYAGQIGGCDQFLHQYSLVLDQQPHTFPTDGAKVAFVMSLLSGQAALWAMAGRRRAAACWTSDRPTCPWQSTPSPSGFWPPRAISTKRRCVVSSGGDSARESRMSWQHGTRLPV
ncbi:uncharacterized protein LOC144044685 [Vanacampus margaritifer]